MKYVFRRSGRLKKHPLLCVLVILVYCWLDGFITTTQAQPVIAADELIRSPYVEEELIFVKVKVFGEEALFAIDTGSSISLFDNSFEKQLGKPVETRRLETVTGNIFIKCYSAPVMKILNGGSELELNVPIVGVIDLTSVRSSLAKPISGLIGMDYLKDHVLRLNFDEGYMAVVRMPRAAPADIKRIDLGSAEHIRPSVRMRISDDQFRDIGLDTGSLGNLCLDSALFSKLNKRGKIALEGKGVSAGASGFADSRVGILDRLEFGEICLQNIEASSIQKNLVGLKFLERFEAEFDFPNRKAYFRPGKRLHDPPRKNLSHFAVKLVDDKLVVLGSRGMAEAAGIRVGDVLVMINGRPAQEMTISEFRRLQCKTDTELKLRFERDGKPFDVSLTLTRPPNPFPDKPLDF